MNTDEIVKALQERFDKITGAYEVMSALAEARKEEIESLATQLAELQRRADAAVEDLEYACGSSGEFELRSICDICRRKQTDGTCPTQCEMNSLAASNKWQWRGPQDEDAEEQGRLVRVPCKVGDVLYKPYRDGIDCGDIHHVNIDIESDIGSFEPSDIGKTVFLTRALAKEAQHE